MRRAVQKTRWFYSKWRAVLWQGFKQTATLRQKIYLMRMLWEMGPEMLTRQQRRRLEWLVRSTIRDFRRNYGNAALNAAMRMGNGVLTPDLLCGAYEYARRSRRLEAAMK